MEPRKCHIYGVSGRTNLQRKEKMCKLRETNLSERKVMNVKGRVLARNGYFVMAPEAGETW